MCFDNLSFLAFSRENAFLLAFINTTKDIWIFISQLIEIEKLSNIIQE